MRKRGRVDSNHGEIRDALRQVGAEVFDLSTVGGGCPDLLVSYRGLHLLEVKARRGRLTADQVAFHRRWSVQIVRDVDEALQAIGAKR